MMVFFSYPHLPYVTGTERNTSVSQGPHTRTDMLIYDKTTKRSGEGERKQGHLPMSRASAFSEIVEQIYSMTD